MESGADEAYQAYVIIGNCEIGDTDQLAIAHKWGTKALMAQIIFCLAPLFSLDT